VPERRAEDASLTERTLTQPSTTTCRNPQCNNTLSTTAKACPKCHHPTKPKLGHCRICDSVLDVDRYRYRTTSSYIRDGNTQYRSHTVHVPCPECGELKPLLRPLLMKDVLLILGVLALLTLLFKFGLLPDLSSGGGS
jgi:hypothetical protein